MNIEIANRLVKLRKEKGYSQEQLAELLGISRQAVSKWERAEASPDTDNLIELAKLYNVSLDSLLGIKEENKDIVSITPSGIDIIDEEDKIHIGFDGVEIVEKDKKQEKLFDKIFCSIVSGVAVLTYVLLGAFLNLWHPAWLIFLLALSIGSIPSVIRNKKITDFSYPIFITALYLFLGFVFSLWHPYWFLFITIPLFYVVFGAIDSYKNKKR